MKLQNEVKIQIRDIFKKKASIVERTVRAFNKKDLQYKFWSIWKKGGNFLVHDF